MKIKFETFIKVLLNNFNIEIHEIQETEESKQFILVHRNDKLISHYVKITCSDDLVSLQVSDYDFFLEEKQLYVYDLGYCTSELEIIDFYVNILIQQGKYYVIFDYKKFMK